MVFSIPVSAQLSGDIISTTPKQGNMTYGILGPATSVCISLNSSDCDNQFQSATSVHIGEHDYSGSTNPFAEFEIELPVIPYCILDENLALELRFQTNDVWHGSGADHDVYVHVYDWLNNEYDLLDSTVNSETSSGRQGTLHGSDEIGGDGDNNNHKVNTELEFINQTTRIFNNNFISETSEDGLYLMMKNQNENTISKIKIKISTNPGSTLGYADFETRIEVDWLRVNYSLEEILPNNPENPIFSWDDESLWADDGSPIGPTNIGWYNSGSENLVNLNFGIGGRDDCGFEHLQYKWQPTNSIPPSSLENGSVLYPEDATNSEFSGIEIPSDSGEYYFWYKSVDITANIAEWVPSDIFSFDFDPPVPNYPFLDGKKYTTNNPEISWESPLAFDGQIGSGLSRCIIEIDGLQILEINKDECSSTNGSIILPAIEDGTHHFAIIACDVANNCNEENNPRSFVINTGFEIDRYLKFAIFATISVIFSILGVVLYYKDEIWNGL